VLTDNENAVQPPEEKARHPKAAPGAIVRAARRVAGRLAQLFQSLSDEYVDWVPGDGQISYTGGNVGIGTSSPGEKLDVYGAIRTSYGIYNVTANGGYFDVTAGSVRVLASGPNTSTAGTLKLGVMSSNASVYDEALTVDNQGNVGIGTASPAHQLDVAGDGNFSGALYANGAQVYPGVFTGDTGSGGTAGAVPAPAAGDAAAGKILKADGTWSNLPVRDFVQRLADGEGYIHSTGTVNGIVYLGLVINKYTFAGPGKLIRMDPANPSGYTVLPYTDSAHGGIVDWVYVPAKNRIYALFSSASVLVAEISLDLSSHTDVIDNSSYGNRAGSICTDGTNVYIATYSSPSHLLAYSLADWSVVHDLELSTGGKSLNNGHNCRCDGASIFVSSAASDLVNSWAFVRVDLSDLTQVVRAASLPNNTNAVLTDDSCFTADYVWYGSEDSGNIIRVDKSTLASQNVISPGIGPPCFGTFYDGSFIWSPFGTSPGKIARIEPNTLAIVTYQLGPRQDSPNEIWSLGGSLCFAFWQDPALVSLCP
jgi:hypothetical protein